ncbi:MAG: low molecular weight protein-tyrosine-phosphatase [Bacteroidota bacterium]
MKILMVCLGNICRSPLAEGILQDKANKAGLNWQVDSAGTGNWHVGHAPHKLSQKVAGLNGIDICQQKGRQFSSDDMNTFDLIFFMDEDNLADAKQMAGIHWKPAKAGLLLDSLYPGEKKSVPDPYYGGEVGFHEVFELISKACDAIIYKFGKTHPSVINPTV